MLPLQWQGASPVGQAHIRAPVAARALWWDVARTAFDQASAHQDRRPRITRSQPDREKSTRGGKRNRVLPGESHSQMRYCRLFQGTRPGGQRSEG